MVTQKKETRVELRPTQAPNWKPNQTGKQEKRQTRKKQTTTKKPFKMRTEKRKPSETFAFSQDRR